MIRVLVVDDDFMVARIHTAFVERTDGFEVVGTARTGAEALDLAASLAPDLVLLDVHLPDLSGLDVLERLRSEGRNVAVIMVTAERGAAAVRAALHGGAMQYLVKPFEYDDLADRLRRVADALSSLPADDRDLNLFAELPPEITNHPREFSEQVADRLHPGTQNRLPKRRSDRV